MSRLILHEDIECIYKQKTKSVFYLRSGETMEVPNSQSRILTELDANYFIKCRRGSTFYCNLDDPLDELTAEQVSTVMDDMIAADAFDIKSGLKEKASTEIITITTNKLF